MGGDWLDTTVQEVAAPIPNAMAAGPFGSSISSKYFQDSGVPVIRGSNLSSDTTRRLLDEEITFVSEEKAREFTRSMAVEGDLVFTCWGTINQVGIIDKRARYKKYVISNKQMKLTVDPEKADPLFLYYLFSGPEKQEEIISGGIGSSVPGFNLGQLKSHKLRLPPLSMQQHISRVLGSLDDKIEVNRAINRTLEAMAQAIFKSWFVDFDPVKAKIAARESGADPTRTAMAVISGKNDTELDAFQQQDPKNYERLRNTAEAFPEALVESELGMIPEGWGVKPLSETIEILSGGTPKRSEKEYWDGDIPWFTVKDAPADGDIWVVDTDEKISAVGLAKSPAKLLPIGTTIISARGTVGKLALVGTEMAMNQSCYGILPRDGKSIYFNYFNLLGAVDQLRKNTHGAVFDTITKNTFESIYVVLPDESFRPVFEGSVAPLIEGVKSNMKECESLCRIRDGLLPRLLSGDSSFAMEK